MTQKYVQGGNNIGNGYGSLAIYQGRQTNDFNFLDASEHYNFSPVKAFPVSHKTKYNQIQNQNNLNQHNATNKNNFDNQSQVFNFFNDKYQVCQSVQNLNTFNTNKDRAFRKDNQKSQYIYSNQNIPLQTLNRLDRQKDKNVLKNDPYHVNLVQTKSGEDKYDQYMNLYNQYQKLRQRYKQKESENQRLKNQRQNSQLNEQYFQQLIEQNQQLKARMFSRESSHSSFRMHSQAEEGVNRFYVQELEKKNMQLQQENKRISTLLMKKLRSPFC